MKREIKEASCANQGCDAVFTQFNSLRDWCSPKCGYEISQERLKRKAYIESINDTPQTKPDHSIAHQKQLTQEVFNRWVRVVKEKDSGCCISCQRPRGGFEEHAGHYLTVAHAGSLRYEPDNCFVQCSHCNTSLSGNVAEYRKALILKLGIERVEWLEAEGHKTRKYKLAELKDLRAQLSKEIREAVE